MKKQILVVIAVALALQAQAQDVKSANVPAAVKQAFAKQFPSAKATKWEKEDANYEAEFRLGKAETSAVFAPDGAYLEMEQEMKINTLPALAQAYIKNTYGGYEIEEAAKITKADGTVLYEAEMEKGKESFDAMFDAEGRFVEKKMEGEGSAKTED